MAQTPSEVEKAKRIAPALHELTKKLEAEGLLYSALIFDSEGEFLIRGGNAPHSGAELVRLHTYLSLVVAQLESAGHYGNVSLTDMPSSADPQELADKLATMCIQVPPDLLPSRILSAATEYLDARQL